MPRCDARSEVLMRRYGLSEESAFELLTELADLTSLESLAGLRVPRGPAGGKCVPPLHL